MLVVEVVVVARARVGEASGAAVLVADGILVDRGIGLGCAVVGRGDAVTGFTAIVAVPVVHSAVWVFICTEAHAHGKRKKFIRLFDVVLIECSNRRKEKQEKEKRTSSKCCSQLTTCHVAQRQEALISTEPFF